MSTLPHTIKTYRRMEAEEEEDAVGGEEEAKEGEGGDTPHNQCQQRLERFRPHPDKIQPRGNIPIPTSGITIGTCVAHVGGIYLIGTPVKRAPTSIPTSNTTTVSLGQMRISTQPQGGESASRRSTE